MIAEYHSQYGEDKWIRENLNPPPGLFVEVGAFDGIVASNTLHFEKNNWHGFLVEADPELAGKSLANRIAPTICGAVGLPIPVMPPHPFRPFHVNTRDRGLSGLKCPGDKTILAPIFPLSAIIDLIPAAVPIGILSIDTEGTELEVWNTRGFRNPTIVIMEYQTCENPPNDAAIVEQMTKDGYKEVHRTACNLIFTRA